MNTKIDSDAAFPIHEEENGMYSLKIDPVLFNINIEKFCDPNTKLLYNSVMLGSGNTYETIVTSVKVMLYVAKMQKFKVLAISANDKSKNNLLDHIGNLLRSECVTFTELKGLRLNVDSQYVILVNDAILLRQYLGNNKFSKFIKNSHAVIIMDSKVDPLIYKAYSDFKFPKMTVTTYNIKHAK